MTVNNYKFHFLFGLSPDFNGKEFSYFHYLNLKSCWLTQNQPNIYIHYLYEPQNNTWWNKIKEFCKLERHKVLPDLVYNCNNKKVWRVEHQSDILRLLLLKERGGIYADIDTLFYKSFFPKFEKEEFVLGQEGVYHVQHDSYQITGLCNALIISHKDAEFLNIWLDSYKENYDDYDWNKMSVRVPYEISKVKPDLVQIEPVASFHKYNWNNDFYHKGAFSPFMSDDGIYSKHMAESKIFLTLKEIDANYFNESSSLYSRMCKNTKGLL